jgi:predicted nucleotidyltransferase
MDPSHLSDDFREFLTCLNEAGVEYLVVGGHAVAYYGYVRPTRDMDIWVAVSGKNAERLVQAVKIFFGADLAGLSPQWFLDSENVTRFGAVPNLIEILPKISGGEFATAYARRVMADIDGQKINMICLADLIANKKSSARLKDLADVEQLTTEN